MNREILARRRAVPGLTGGDADILPLACVQARAYVHTTMGAIELPAGFILPVIGIRRIEVTDAPLIEQYASDARIAETSHVPHPYPRGGGATFAASAVSAWARRSECTFVVTADDALVGLVSLMAINRLRASAQVGYWIAVPYWGRGFATEALRLAVEFGFKNLHLVEVGAGCLARNSASARVLEKNGFVEQAPFSYDGPDLRFRGALIRRFSLSR